MYFGNSQDEQYTYLKICNDSLVVKEIYKQLGIVDSKASTRLRYDGIAIAVIAILLFDYSPTDAQIAGDVPFAINAVLNFSAKDITLLASFVLLAFAAAIAMFVTYPFWFNKEALDAINEFEAAKDKNPDSEAAPAVKDNKANLNGVQTLLRRNTYLKLSWWLSAAGSILLAVAITMTFFS